MNSVIISGRLVADPVVRDVGTTKVVNFTVAVNGRTYEDKQGNKKQDVAFLDVEAWDVAADVISKHLHKGEGIYVEGSLRTDKWTDAQQNKRSKTVVRCNRWEFPLRNKPHEEGEKADTEAKQELVPF